MNKTNALPMVKNLFVPMFQDNSGLGKSISFAIRFWWVGIGSIYSLVLSLPYFFLFLIILVIPLLPVVQLVVLYFNLAK